jgi:hypothetical protein
MALVKKRAERPRPQKPSSNDRNENGLRGFLTDFRQAVQLDTTAPRTPPAPIRCVTCQDQGWVTRPLPVEHPDFGRAFACPDCGGGPAVWDRQRAALAVMFGNVWLAQSPKLYQYDLQSFVELNSHAPHLAYGKTEAIDKVWEWTQDRGAPCLTLSGEPGLGKTCLAGAAFLERVNGRAGLAIEYNALMDLLLGLVADDKGDPAKAVRLAARAPVLLLDDLGNTFVRGSETAGRQRWLFEVVNYRYNQGLPTILTTNLSIDGLYEQFDAKIGDRLLEDGRAIWARLSGPSLRFPGGGA